MAKGGNFEMRRPPSDLARYSERLADIKKRIRQAQIRAALSANAEMLWMYWDIGQMIADRQQFEGWGAGVIPRLAVDLKSDLPEKKGFSARNLRLMIHFYKEYPGLHSIWQPPVAKLPEKVSSNEIGIESVTELPETEAAGIRRLKAFSNPQVTG
jgi:hypothetical protein